MKIFYQQPEYSTIAAIILSTLMSQVKFNFIVQMYPILSLSAI